MEAKLKHLEFIQSVISRMAHNSFLLKGWSVTVAGGLFALTFKEMECVYLLISLLVLTCFWLLDSYYLFRERLFIEHYKHVSANESNTDFSMDTDPYRKEIVWAGSAFSGTIAIFYGGLLAAHLLIIFIK
jgi:hypothetical protein